METNTKIKGDILAERIETIIKTGHAHYLVSDIKAALADYRKQWKLGRSVNGFTLGEGQEWHRQDFKEDMLPDGWRPLLLGEVEQPAKDQCFVDNEWYSNPCSSEDGARVDDNPRRTSRPLPEVKKPVPLGPKDVKCGDVLSIDSLPQCNWMIVGVETHGIRTYAGFMTWFKLQDYKISRDGGKTWEACEKEAK